MAGYGTDDGFTAWMASMGYAAPVDPNNRAYLRQRGSEYIDGLYSGAAGAKSGQVYSGHPTDGVAQERAWPRTGATYSRQPIASDAVPDAVVRASYYAAYAEVASPGSLSVSVTASRQVKRQKVEGIEREFFGPSDGVSSIDSVTPVFSSIYGLLKPFLIDQSGVNAGLWSVGRGC